MRIHNFNTYINENNNNDNIILIKSKLDEVFSDDTIGVINSTTTNNNYSFITLKVIFYDRLFKYIMYFNVDNIKTDMSIDIIIKKYDANTTALIGSLDTKIDSLDKITKDFFIDLKNKLEEKFNPNNDELEIEYK